MEVLILIVHLFLAMALVGVILLQKSEGGALGMGGGGGMGGFLSARGAANLLTRTTAILATLFIITSLSLAIISSSKRTAQPRSIVDPPGRSGPATPGPAAPEKPAAPAPAPAAPEKK